MLAVGASLEEILKTLRISGAYQIDTIKALREVMGIGLGEGKAIVDSSQTWADQRAVTSHARKVAAQAAEEWEAESRRSQLDGSEGESRQG
jgi:ribosomal protein L7/L12